MPVSRTFAAVCILLAAGSPALAQTPGDAMIEKYLAQETDKLTARGPRRRQDAGGMAGAPAAAEGRVPRHARPLAAAGEDAAARRPSPARSSATASSSRSCTSRASRACTSPATSTGPKNDRQASCPPILYVCGHSGRGRDGNKTAFQDHGLWFATNGYVCLVVDTLQLGEIAGVHHGT